MSAGDGGGDGDDSGDGDGGHGGHGDGFGDVKWCWGMVTMWCWGMRTLLLDSNGDRAVNSLSCQFIVRVRFILYFLFQYSFRFIIV